MLLPHNIEVFSNLEQTLAEHDCCCVVMGTGCGKTYVASEYLDKYNFKALVVAPRHSICDSWENHSELVDTITYQKLANIYKDIDYSKYDVVICDEVHHIGAPKWGKAIKYIIDNKFAKVIGLTESSVRYTDGGRDVAEEYFNGNIVFGESVSTAIEKKILNPVTYVGAMYNSDGLKKTLQGKIQSRLYAKLNLVINKTPTITEILKKNMLPGKRKGIIFASTIEDIESAIGFVKSVYPNVEIKHVHSKQSESHNEEIFEWFKNTDEGYICSVDMISEGVHIKGVNTLIMLRRTESVNLFNQQLGRCLDASSKEPAILFDLVNNKYSIKIVNKKFRIRTNSIMESGKLNIVPSEQLIVKDYTKDIIDVLKEIKFNLEGHWTEEEDQKLKDYYATHPGGTGVIKFIKENFPERTLLSVKSRAKILGLTTPNAVPFTDEENEIIKKYYPNEGKNCIKRLPNRTLKSLYAQVNKLNVTYNREDIWTDEEIEILKKYYPVEGRKTAKRLPTIRSGKAISAKAKTLGLKTGKNIPFSKEEDELILTQYEKLGAKKIASIINRSEGSIRKRASDLNVKYVKPKILCVETGQIFETAKDAAIQMKLHSPTTISVCLNGYKKTAYGYHWKKIIEKNK